MRVLVVLASLHYLNLILYRTVHIHFQRFRNFSVTVCVYYPPTPHLDLLRVSLGWLWKPVGVVKSMEFGENPPAIKAMQYWSLLKYLPLILGKLCSQAAAMITGSFCCICHML